MNPFIQLKPIRAMLWRDQKALESWCETGPIEINPKIFRIKNLFAASLMAMKIMWNLWFSSGSNHHATQSVVGKVTGSFMPRLSLLSLRQASSIVARRIVFPLLFLGAGLVFVRESTSEAVTGNGLTGTLSLYTRLAMYGTSATVIGTLLNNSPSSMAGRVWVAVDPYGPNCEVFQVASITPQGTTFVLAFVPGQKAQLPHGVGAYVAIIEDGVVTPQLFGAYADGSNASITTAAIQSALNATGNVYISPGTYSISSNITIPANAVLSGAGPSSLLQLLASARLVAGNVSTGNHAVLCDFKCWSNSASCPSAIQLTNVFEFTIERMYFDGGTLAFTTGAIDIEGTYPNNNAQIRILSCAIQGAAGDGIHVADDWGAGGILIAHNNIQGNLGYGIRVPTKGTHNGWSEIHITFNAIEGNTLGQVYADTLVASTIVGNHFENSPSGSGASVIPVRIADGGVFLSGNGGPVHGLEIRANSFAGVNASHLIEIGGTKPLSSIVIEGNSFAQASSAAIYIPNAPITGLALGPNAPQAASCATLLAINASITGIRATGGNGRTTVNNLGGSDYAILQDAFWFADAIEAYGTLTANIKLIVPLNDGWQKTFYNGTSGAHSLTVIGNSGTGIVVAQGKTAVLRCNGTNVLRVTPDT
jgi:hypothetical protein